MMRKLCNISPRCLVRNFQLLITWANANKSLLTFYYLILLSVTRLNPISRICCLLKLLSLLGFARFARQNHEHKIVLLSTNLLSSKCIYSLTIIFAQLFCKNQFFSHFIQSFYYELINFLILFNFKIYFFYIYSIGFIE